MILALLAAAATIDETPAARGPGLRGNPASLFGPGAYPPEALRAREQGRVVTTITVSAAGVPTGCAVTESSGSASLDTATCRAALSGLEFDPAIDTEGRPIAATFRLPVRWSLPAEGEKFAVAFDGPVGARTCRVTWQAKPRTLRTGVCRDLMRSVQALTSDPNVPVTVTIDETMLDPK